MYMFCADRSEKIDLHIHTCYSDGALTPSEIVKRYKDKGYEMIAITDHDTVAGVNEALAAGAKVGLKVIPGIEISTIDYEADQIHVLGYDMDIENAEFKEQLGKFWEARRVRNEKLIRFLAEEGYPLTYDDLLVGKLGGYIGKPDFGRAMVRRGYIKTPKEIFTPGKYLESPEAKKIKKERMETEVAISLIRGAGGKPVLAHPIQIKGLGTPGSDEYFARFEDVLERFKKRGLLGLEAYHPDHTAEQAAIFERIAEKHGLMITRGSDFHGDDFKKIQK